MLLHNHRLIKKRGIARPLKNGKRVDASSSRRRRTADGSVLAVHEQGSTDYNMEMRLGFRTPVKERENGARHKKDKASAALPTGIYYA
nr:hypothetical protein [Clostridia bacterium]